MPFEFFQITQVQKKELESLVKILARHSWSRMDEQGRQYLSGLYEKMVTDPQCSRYFEFYQVAFLGDIGFQEQVQARMHDNICELRKLYPSIAVH